MKVTTDACLFGAWVASEMKNRNWEMENEFVLDIGTGTGLLSLMIAQKYHGRITAVEIDAGAVEQAKENIAASPWKERIVVHHADIRKSQPGSKYDVIVSNPPFYENELQSPDNKINLARHGQELSFVDLVAAILRHLSPTGIFYLLLPYKRIEEMRSLLGENKLQIFTQVNVRQTANQDPFRVMIAGGLSAEFHPDTTATEITVWDSNKMYSPKFKSLLKDYYLAR